MFVVQGTVVIVDGRNLDLYISGQMTQSSDSGAETLSIP